MDALWRIEMLGWLRATHDDRVVSRFRTRKTAALLAYLAFHAHRSHPRDALVELLWSESDPDIARTAFRVALSSLRRQLEPPGVPAGAVILADRANVQLNPAAITTDVSEFETALAAAARTDDAAARIARLTEAAALYRGELLPGFYEDWVLVERERMAEVHLQALGQLVSNLEATGDLAGALEYARRAVAADPLREEAHRDLIRLLEASGQSDAARRQSEELARIPARERGDLPSADARARPRTGTGSAAKTAGSGSTATAASDASNAGLTSGGVPLAGASPAPIGSLPLSLTRFFGREREIASLRELLLAADTRLVTLTGPGGSGKTRLAQEVAARLRESLQGSVWFVPLMDLADPRRIADQMRDALRLPRASDAEPLEQLVAFLARQPSLLLLDNFEHLVDEGAPVVQALLERIAGLTVLVTSRRRLDLPGERDFLVLPLPTPKAPASAAVRRPDGRAAMQDNPERLLECASVRLFVDRAQAVRPDFQLRTSNAAAVAMLCERLEGLPLALELAATRIGVLTPAQMLARLEQRFDLLSRSGRAAGRHRSLRAALDWSYQLLPSDLQRFFARLSVFRGGWTLAAAEAICAGPQALDYLQQLRECSLVVAQEEGEEMRFRLLETIREYGQEQLAERGEEEATRQRHATFFLELAEQGEQALVGAAQAEWLARLEAEHDNLRAALAWSVASAQMELGFRLVGALHRFWHLQGFLTEGLERITELLTLAGPATPTLGRSRALGAAGALATHKGDYAAARGFQEENLAVARALNDPVRIASALYGLGRVVVDQGDLEAARAHCEEGLLIFRELGDRAGIAVSLHVLAVVAHSQGDMEAARSFNEESLAVRRQIGDRWLIANSLVMLGRIAQAQGYLAEARARIEEGLAIMRALGANFGIAVTLFHLGGVVLRQGDLETSRSHYEESLPLNREMGNKEGCLSSLRGLGLVALHQGDLEAARSHFDECLTLARELGSDGAIADVFNSLAIVALREGDAATARALLEESLTRHRQGSAPETVAQGLNNLAYVAGHEGDAGPAAAHCRESLAIRRDQGDRWGIVECLEHLAEIAAGQVQSERAARLFGAAVAVRDAVQALRPPVSELEYQRSLTAVQTALGEEAFATAWAEGQAMPLEQAITYALEEP